jgi:hypothetical protein
MTVIGVDAHKASLTAVAVDEVGREEAVRQLVATHKRDYDQAVSEARSRMETPPTPAPTAA